jgi:N-acetylneuraminic acid mutarotase
MQRPSPSDNPRGEPPRHPALVLLSMLSCLCGCGPRQAAEPPPRDDGTLVWARLADLPDRVGVAGAFAGVCGAGDGLLVVAGGANFPDRPPWEAGVKAWHDTAWVLADPRGRWQAATPLPEPLGYGVSASFAGRVWCVGGGDATRHVASTISLGWDAAAGRLVVERDALPALPKPVANAAGVLVGSRLYIAGGQETPDATTALATFWSIDLANPAAGWREHAAWPGPPRILPVLGAVDGHIYLVSGAELVVADAEPPTVTRRFLRDAYRFDPETEAWTVLSPAPVPLIAAAGPAIPRGGKELVFLPGDDGEFFERRMELAGRHPGFPRRMWLYDTAADTWREAGAIPATIDGVPTATPVTTPTVAWRGRTIIPSGEIKPGVRTPAILSATPAR